MPRGLQRRAGRSPGAVFGACLCSGCSSSALSSRVCSCLWSGSFRAHVSLLCRLSCAAQFGFQVEKGKKKHLKKLGRRFVGSRHCAAAFSLQVPNSCADLHPTLLDISILGTYSKFVWINNMLALSSCLPQPCPSAGRRFVASRSRLNHR